METRELRIQYNFDDLITYVRGVTNTLENTNQLEDIIHDEVCIYFENAFGVPISIFNSNNKLEIIQEVIETITRERSC